MQPWGFPTLPACEFFAQAPPLGREIWKIEGPERWPRAARSGENPLAQHAMFGINPPIPHAIIPALLRFEHSSDL
jgi:hypothetical protein